MADTPDTRAGGSEPEPEPDSASTGRGPLRLRPGRTADALRAGRASWAFLLFGIAITGLQFWLLPDQGFWTPDDGNKYLIGRAEDSGFLRPALPYLGREIDPELRWAPIRTPFAHVVDGRLVSQYPPAFSLLSRLVDASGVGKAHLLIPLLGSLLVLLAVGRLAPALGAPRSLSLLLAWPLSPLIFYGTLHWEHTLVAALVTVGLGSLVLTADGRSPGVPGIRAFRGRDGLRGTIRGAGLAGACLALATGLREETVLIFLAAGIVLLRHDRAFFVRLSIVYGVFLLPFVAWQWIGTGSLIGLHFRGNVDFQEAGFVGWTLERREVVRALLFSSLPLSSWVGVMIGGVLGLGGAFALGLAGRSPSNRNSGPGQRSGLGWPPHRGSLFRSWALAVVLLGVGVVSFWTYRTLEDSLQPMVLVRCSGLLLFAPWIVFVFAPLSAQPLRTLRSIVGLAALFFLLATPPISASGVHWGPRILLSLLPSAAWLVAAGFESGWRDAVGRGIPWHARRRTVLGALGGLSLLAVLFFQLSGLALQRRSVEGIVAMRDQTRAALARSSSPEESVGNPAASIPIVTHLWWYAQLLAPLSLERPIYQVRSEDDLVAWFNAFSKGGSKRFYLATAAPDHEILRGLPLRVRPVAEIGDPRQPTLRHRLLEVERAPEPPRKKRKGSFFWFGAR